MKDFFTRQLLLYMREAARTLNECGADPAERYFYPAPSTDELVSLKEYLSRIYDKTNERRRAL